jgi:hypothetical protein
MTLILTISLPFSLFVALSVECDIFCLHTLPVSAPSVCTHGTSRYLRRHSYGYFLACYLLEDTRVVMRVRHRH